MKKALSLVLILAIVMGLAACGGGDASSTAASTATPAIVPPASGSASASVPEPVVLNQALLTGLEKDANYPEGKRITAVMVNNIASSRPTRGLSDAKIVVEIKTEGGITRFMALFDDYETMPEVGPVRSARDQFFQLLLPFWGFYVHDGQSTPMTQFFKDWEYDEFDLAAAKYGVASNGPSDGSMNWRDPTRRSQGYPTEYTEYTDGAHIAQTIQSNDLDDYRSYGSPMFNFVSYLDEPRIPQDGPMTELAVIHSSSYISQFNYDSASGQYKMSQWNSSKGRVEETIDENNGEQLAFDNLVVLFAPMTLYANSPLVKVDYYGGAGYYYSQGHYELIFWQKGGPNQALQLLRSDRSGEPIQVNPGTTYIAVVDDNELPAYDDAMKSGNAAEVTGGGDVNANEVETED